MDSIVETLGLQSKLQNLPNNLSGGQQQRAAIALTTVLFTSLFTIASSINYSFQQENFRQAGGDFHAAVKDLTWEQVEELRTDPLIKEDLARMFVGMPGEPPFNKPHVEVSCLEPAAAPHYFCVPVEGALPREGTDEAATDARVLALLGVEPRVGEKFTVSFCIDENTVRRQLGTRTFTLSGWREYDSAVVANHVLLPRSAAGELCALGSGDLCSMTGKWNLDVMFQNAAHIEDDIGRVLENHGSQGGGPQGENCLKTGVNWGYTGARLSNSFDPMTAAAIAALLLLIIFTGYLIIYSVFQISVTNDIRFYGLLKTIGTIGKQQGRIVRQQALLLSLAGIPLGLLVGWFIGSRLTPVIIAQLNGIHSVVSVSPVIFVAAALVMTVCLVSLGVYRSVSRLTIVERLQEAEA